MATSGNFNYSDTSSYNKIIKNGSLDGNGFEQPLFAYPGSQGSASKLNEGFMPEEGASYMVDPEAEQNFEAIVAEHPPNRLEYLKKAISSVESVTPPVSK